MKRSTSRLAGDRASPTGARRRRPPGSPSRARRWRRRRDAGASERPRAGRASGRERRPANQPHEREPRRRRRRRARWTSRSANSPTTIENGAVVVGRELDHADHQCDADRVVEARLALEDRPGAPPISCPPRTENMTAGSVGASAAPISPATVHEGRARRGPRPRAARRCRTCRAPRGRRSARATRGTVQARSASRPRTGSRSARASRSAATSWMDRIPASRSERSEAAAARTRSAPAVGIARRPAIARTASASTRAPETTRISLPNSTRSSMRRSCTSARRVRRRPPEAAYTFLTPVSPRTHAPYGYFARMRLALLTACRARLAVPGGGLRPRPAGSLSVEDARGTVVLKGKGIVIGRLERGEVEIVDLTPLDQWSPRVNGVPRGRTVVDARQEHQLLHSRRPLPDHGAR